MLMATSRRRNLGVGVAGVLDLNLLSLGALDLSGIVGSVSGERGQTNVPTVLRSTSCSIRCVPISYVVQIGRAHV